MKRDLRGAKFLGHNNKKAGSGFSNVRLSYSHLPRHLRRKMGGVYFAPYVLHKEHL